LDLGKFDRVTNRLLQCEAGERPAEDPRTKARRHATFHRGTWPRKVTVFECGGGGKCGVKPTRPPALAPEEQW